MCLLLEKIKLARKKYMFILPFTVLLLLLIMILSSWERNETIVKEYVQVPELGKDSGFYEKVFGLKITADENTTIYYTLDGTIPDEKSLVYKEPICIDNATVNENNYSMITDVSVGFRTDLLEAYQVGDDPEYTAPDYLVDKCTVVRAVAIDDHGNRSEEAIGSYFVGISPDDYDGCNVISLVTDSGNLFDYEKGIYVTGEKFDQYIERGKVNYPWMTWDANYHQRGKEWERDAYISVFSENGEIILEKTVGIRVRGNYSRAMLPKGLNLYAKTEEGLKDTFGYQFFGNDYDPSSISLTSGGNQVITQFNDFMMTDRVSNLNISTTKYSPYVLFINGEYWGFYWLAEKFDEDYFAHYYDVDSSDVVMIKNGEIELGRDQDYRMYHEMRNFITLMDMSKDECYAEACEIIDIDSFIDYYATMLYIARCEDWPLNNFALWRTRSDDGTGYADGKWRWILFDCNSMCMRDDQWLTEDDTLDMLLRSDQLFISFWDNMEFRERFKERLAMITEECFDADEMESYINNYEEAMLPILEKSWKRFYGSKNDKVEEYREMLDSNRRFFVNRPKKIWEILKTY